MKNKPLKKQNFRNNWTSSHPWFVFFCFVFILTEDWKWDFFVVVYYIYLNVFEYIRSKIAVAAALINNTDNDKIRQILSKEEIKGTRNIKSSHWRCTVKRCSEKFCKLHRKTPVLESLVNKRCSNLGVFLWNLRNFKNTYFEEHLRTVVSKIWTQWTMKQTVVPPKMWTFPRWIWVGPLSYIIPRYSLFF